MPLMMKLDDVELPAEAAEKIRQAAKNLLNVAMDELGGNPLHAIGALLLAGGTAAAWGRLEYKQMIDLVSAYYEHVLVEDAERQLLEAGQAAVFMRKPQGVQ